MITKYTEKKQYEANMKIKNENEIKFETKLSKKLQKNCLDILAN